MSPSLISLGFVDWRMKTATNHIYEWGVLDITIKVGWDACTIFVPDALSDCDTGLLVGVLQDHNLGQLNSEPDS